MKGNGAWPGLNGGGGGGNSSYFPFGGVSGRPWRPRSPSPVATLPPVPPAAPTPELLAAADSVEWTVPTRPAAGLRNRGNTCFLNATLQALTHTPALARIALSHLHVTDCHGVSCALCVLLKQIRNGLTANTYDVSPDEILALMHHFARSLTRGRQEDAHELLRLTTEALHHAGLLSVGCPTHGPKAAPAMRDRTVVERVFGGMLSSAVTCRSCGAVSRTFDTFEDLSLELQHGVLSVDDALAAFTHTERLDSENKYKCSSCQQLTAAEKRITVAKAPNVLVLHLKRFSALGGKITRGVTFEETLSLQPHMSEVDEGAHYSLYSVVVHEGYTVSGGHYHAYARDAHGTWRNYNDTYVSEVTLPAVLRNASGAYILFYQRMHPPAPPFVLPSSTAPAAPPATGLKRKRAVLPGAFKVAQARLISDGAVTALEKQLRVSELLPLLRANLRDVRLRLPTNATPLQLVRAWRAEGHYKAARLLIGDFAPIETRTVVHRAVGELEAQLEEAAGHTLAV